MAPDEARKTVVHHRDHGRAGASTLSLVGTPPARRLARRATLACLFLAAPLVSLAAASPVSSQTGSSQAASGQAPSAVRATPGPLTACWGRERIAQWPLRRQIGGLVMVGIPISSAARAAALVADLGLAGILVRGAPTAGSRAALLTIAKAQTDVPTFVAVDEEGGRVQHLRGSAGVLPSAAVMAKTMTAAQVRDLAFKHGKAMRALGFTLDFAPILDLANGNANGIGDRAWSTDPSVTAAYGLAFSQGLLDAGVFPVVKHFPGHGYANGDSHNLGVITPPIEVLRARDMVPFRQVFGQARVGVMVGHLQVPGFSDVPATLSSRLITEVLRNELHFGGLVVTDSLSMWPIRYYFSAAHAAELALRAGNDVLLYDDDPNVASVIDSLTEVVQADPTLWPRVVDANLRVLAAKGLPICTPSTTASTAATSSTVISASSTTTVVP